MGGLGDYHVAAAMRDVITKIAADTVRRMRPDIVVGTVETVDLAARTAIVTLPGHTEDVPNRLQAKFSPHRAPTAPGTDIVRVAGKPGAYWIIDFVRGAPSFFEPGFLMPYAGDVQSYVPPGWLACLGQYVLIDDYPALFARIQHNFNRTNDIAIDPADGTFRLPDWQGRYILGADTAASDPGLLLGNDDDASITARVNRLTHSHDHSISGQSGTNTWDTPNTGGNAVPRESAYDGHAHGGVTGPASGILSGNWHAWQTAYVLIKT